MTSLNTQAKLRILRIRNKENFGICLKQVKNRKAFIVGISSTFLKKNEIDFLKTNKPWGVILFSRNINDFSQTKKLVNQIKSCFHDNKYPILIDEEGGKVSRLKKIIGLPIIKDDTNDIIEYTNEVEDFKNEKQRKFWDLFKTSEK